MAYTLLDQTSNGNNLTAVNGASEYTATHPFVASTEAVSLALASEQRLDVANVNLNVTGHFSVKCNFYMTSVIPTSEDFFFFQNRSVNTNVAGYDIKLGYGGAPDNAQLCALTGKNTGIVPNTDYKETFGATKVTINTWHEATMVYDGSYLITYLDGVEESKEAWTSPPGYAATQYYHIGCRNNAGTPSGWMNGYITNISVWNRDLTPTEATSTYYNKLQTGAESGIIAYWPFQLSGSPSASGSLSGSASESKSSSPSLSPSGSPSPSASESASESLSESKSGSPSLSPSESPSPSGSGSRSVSPSPSESASPSPEIKYISYEDKYSVTAETYNAKYKKWDKLP